MRVKFGPWTPDQPDLDSGGLEECTNCMPLSGSGYEALRNNATLSGTVTISLAIGDNIGGSIIVRRPTQPGDDSTHLFVGTCGTNAKLYQFTPSDSTPSIGSNTDRSRTATYSSGASTWSFTQFGDQVLAANGQDAMQIKELSTSTSFLDQSASASAPIAGCLATVRDFVFAGRLDGITGTRQNVVQWSQINNARRWTANPRLQSDSQVLPDHGRVTAMTGGDFATILMEDGVWRATYVGSPVIFRFDNVAPRIGCHSQRSVAQYQNLTFFLGRDSFYLFDGAQCIDIADGSIKKLLQETTSAYVPGRVHGVFDDHNKAYIVSMPGEGVDPGNETGRTTLLVYSIATRTWSKVTKSHSGITKSLLLGRGASVVQNLTGARNRRLGLGLFTPYVFDVSGDKVVYTEFTASTYMTATFATGEVQLFPDRRGFVTGVRPLIQGDANTTITVEVGSRDRLTQTTSYASAVSVNSNGLSPQRVNARYHRVRVNVTGGFEEAIGFDLDARPEGRR